MLKETGKIRLHKYGHGKHTRAPKVDEGLTIGVKIKITFRNINDGGMKLGFQILEIFYNLFEWLYMTVLIH